MRFGIFLFVLVMGISAIHWRPPSNPPWPLSGDNSKAVESPQFDTSSADWILENGTNDAYLSESSTVLRKEESSDPGSLEIRQLTKRDNNGKIICFALPARYTIEQLISCKGNPIKIEKNNSAVIDISKANQKQIDAIFLKEREGQRRKSGSSVQMVGNDMVSKLDIKFNLALYDLNFTVSENKMLEEIKVLIDFQMDEKLRVNVTGNRRLLQESIDELRSHSKINKVYLQDVGECIISNPLLSFDDLEDCKYTVTDLIIDGNTDWTKAFPSSLTEIRGCLKITGTDMENLDFIIKNSLVAANCTKTNEISGNSKLCLHPQKKDELKGKLQTNVIFTNNNACAGECSAEYVLREKNPDCQIITDTLEIKEQPENANLSHLNSVTEIRGRLRILNNNFEKIDFFKNLKFINATNHSESGVDIKFNNKLTSFEFPSIQSISVDQNQKKFYVLENGQYRVPENQIEEIESKFGPGSINVFAAEVTPPPSSPSGNKGNKGKKTQKEAEKEAQEEKKKNLGLGFGISFVIIFIIILIVAVAIVIWVGLNKYKKRKRSRYYNCKYPSLKSVRKPIFYPIKLKHFPDDPNAVLNANKKLIRQQREERRALAGKAVKCIPQEKDGKKDSENENDVDNKPLTAAVMQVFEEDTDSIEEKGASVMQSAMKVPQTADTPNTKDGAVQNPQTANTKEGEKVKETANTEGGGEKAKEEPPKSKGIVVNKPKEVSETRHAAGKDNRKTGPGKGKGPAGKGTAGKGTKGTAGKGTAGKGTVGKGTVGKKPPVKTVGFEKHFLFWPDLYDDSKQAREGKPRDGPGPHDDSNMALSELWDYNLTRIRNRATQARNKRAPLRTLWNGHAELVKTLLKNPTRKRNVDLQVVNKVESKDEGNKNVDKQEANEVENKDDVTKNVDKQEANKVENKDDVTKNVDKQEANKVENKDDVTKNVDKQEANEVENKDDGTKNVDQQEANKVENKDGGIKREAAGHEEWNKKRKRKRERELEEMRRRKELIEKNIGRENLKTTELCHNRHIVEKMMFTDEIEAYSFDSFLLDPRRMRRIYKRILHNRAVRRIREYQQEFDKKAAHIRREQAKDCGPTIDQITIPDEPGDGCVGDINDIVNMRRERNQKAVIDFLNQDVSLHFVTPAEMKHWELIRNGQTKKMFDEPNAIRLCECFETLETRRRQPLFLKTGLPNKTEVPNASPIFGSRAIDAYLNNKECAQGNVEKPDPLQLSGVPVVHVQGFKYTAKRMVSYANDIKDESIAFQEMTNKKLNFDIVCPKELSTEFVMATKEQQEQEHPSVEPPAFVTLKAYEFVHTGESEKPASRCASFCGSLKGDPFIINVKNPRQLKGKDVTPDEFLKSMLECLMTCGVGKWIEFDCEDILELCRLAKEEQMDYLLPTVEVETGPCRIYGESRGMFDDLRKAICVGDTMDMSKNLHQMQLHNHIFLGGYVGNGAFNVETICLIFAMKAFYRSRCVLLRGMTEWREINKDLLFARELAFRYPDNHRELFEAINDVFDHLYFTCTLGNDIECCYGGVIPGQRNLSEVKLPVKELIPDTLPFNLMFTHPNYTVKWYEDNYDLRAGYYTGLKWCEQVMESIKIKICFASKCLQSGWGEFSSNGYYHFYLCSGMNLEQESGQWSAAVADIDINGRIEIKVIYQNEPDKVTILDGDQSSQMLTPSRTNTVTEGKKRGTAISVRTEGTTVSKQEKSTPVGNSKSGQSAVSSGNMPPKSAPSNSGASNTSKPE